MELTGNHEQNMVKAGEFIEDRILEKIEERFQPRFLYNMALGKLDKKTAADGHQVLYQRPHFGRPRVWMTIVEFPSEGNFPGFIAGRGGSVKKMISETLACTVTIFSCNRNPGSYAYITGYDKASVSEAQSIVAGRVSIFPKVMAVQHIESIVSEHAPLPMALVKRLYADRVGAALDNTMLGYPKLGDLLRTIKSIELVPDTRNPHLFDLVPRAPKFESSAIELQQAVLNTESIVREAGSLQLDRLKKEYLAKFNSILDHGALGFERLAEFVNGIGSIEIQYSTHNPNLLLLVPRHPAVTAHSKSSALGVTIHNAL